MTATSSDLVPSYLDVTRLAVRSFLARNREPTLTAYTQDLRAFLGWCKVHDREPLWVSRGELEMYVRHLESRGYAAATVARRFGSVATFYKYPVIDGLITANPAAAVTRPKVAWEGQKRTVLHLWRSPRYSPLPEPPVPATTPWSACSACSGCACLMPAGPTPDPTTQKRRCRALSRWLTRPRRNRHRPRSEGR